MLPRVLIYHLHTVHLDRAIVAGEQANLKTRLLGESGMQLLFQPSRNMGYIIANRIANILMNLKEKTNIFPKCIKRIISKIT